MSVIPPLSGDKRTFGVRGKNDANDPEQTSFTYCSDPAGSRTTRVNNASVLHSAFEFLAIVCSFDLKIVGHRDVVGIIEAVTDGPVAGSLRQSCLAQALGPAGEVFRPPKRERYSCKIT